MFKNLGGSLQGKTRTEGALPAVSQTLRHFDTTYYNRYLSIYKN